MIDEITLNAFMQRYPAAGHELVSASYSLHR
jgi:hypothetical protein